MTATTDEPVAKVEGAPRLRIIIPVLGVTQILAWGSSYYLLAVLAQPIANDTGWPLTWVVGGLSLGLFVSGLVSPRVGDSVQQFGGRLVLAASAVLLALGLIGLAFSPALPIYVISWLVLGVGMGAGLYNSAFALLGSLYGQGARGSITMLTLFGGFASTICWPLSSMLVSSLGWRNTCLVYAGIHLLVALPLYVFLLPREQKAGDSAVSEAKTDQRDTRGQTMSPVSRPLLGLIALVSTLSSMTSALLSVHLLTVLQARDIVPAVAVALGAIVGPSQVAARAVEMLVSRFHHPIWTKLTSTICVAAGVGLLWINVPIAAAALIFYGAGIGLESIAKGTLPLAVFGSRQYPTVVGRIAMPVFIGQAASPSLGAMLIEHFGARGTLATLFAVALVNVVLVVFLLAVVRGQKSVQDSQQQVSPDV